LEDEGDGSMRAPKCPYPPPPKLAMFNYAAVTPHNKFNRVKSFVEREEGLTRGLYTNKRRIREDE